MAELHYIETPVSTNSIADVINDPESAYIDRQEYRMQKSYTIATPDLETSLVSILTIRMGKRRSVRNLLWVRSPTMVCIFGFSCKATHY